MFKLLSFIFSSLLAVIAFMFMPWYIVAETDGGGALSLITDDSVGVAKYTLLLIPLVLIVSIVISMWKRDEATRPWSWYFVLALLNAVPAIWSFFFISDTNLTIGIGVWLLLIASVAMLLLSLTAMLQHRSHSVEAVVADQKSF